MDSKADLAVRSELLWLFLHCMNRFAYATGGLKVRDTLSDAVLGDVIDAVILAAFDTTHAQKTFDVKAWRNKMYADLRAYLNAAELDFSACPELFDGGPTASLKEANVIGKLAGRVERATGVQLGPEGWLLINVEVTKALIASHLKDKVERACGSIK